MNRTIWKTDSEIDIILRGYDDLGIISCGTCANLSGTGGRAGLDDLKNRLKQKGKRIHLARVIIACCPEEIMRRTLTANRRALRKCRALIILSCAGGIKAANSCRPDIPVLSILDSVGSAAVSCTDPLLAQSLCRGCGHCVLTYTAGICPLSECPARSKYGPCKAYEENTPHCVMDSGRECAWKVILNRGGSLKDLAQIRELHGSGTRRAIPSLPRPAKRRLWRSLLAWHAARLQILERIIRPFK